MKRRRRPAEERRVAFALNRIEAARAAVEAAATELRFAIVDAVENTEATYAEVGRAAGLTRARISQIAIEERQARSKGGRKP